MLSKNYSTASIIFAANVIDGGKSLDEVPASFKTDVTELVQSQVPSATPAPATTPTIKAQGGKVTTQSAGEPESKEAVVPVTPTDTEGPAVGSDE